MIDCYTTFYLFIERCSLSITNSVENISSHISMNILNVFQCSAMVGLILYMGRLYLHVPSDYFDNYYQWFRLSLNILIYLAASCICNQLVSAFACRPMNILYDFRFASMIIVQIVGFLICLVFTFLLGIKYALMNYV
jgi:hypothetical protein